MMTVIKTVIINIITMKLINENVDIMLNTMMIIIVMMKIVMMMIDLDEDHDNKD